MKYWIILAAFCMAAGQVGTVQADYVSTHDYGTNFTVKSPDVSGFSDTFVLSGDITAAELTVGHQGNMAYLQPNGLGEMWQVRINGNVIGTLSNSVYDWETNTPITGWVTDKFQLNQSTVAGINNSGSSIKQAFVSFTDELSKSRSSDFRLNTLSLEATALATPLPAAFFLFAPGLIGVYAVRKRC